MIEIKVDTSRVVVHFREIAAGMRGTLIRSVNAALIDLQGYVRSTKLHGSPLKARTGNLSRAITVTPAVDEGGRIFGSLGVDRTAPYGKTQELGVDHPWTIEPKDRKALRFAIGGKVVFAKRVVHPPLKPHPFMRPSLEEKRASINERLRQAVREQIRGGNA